MKKNQIKVDGNAIYRFMHENKITADELSISLGRSESYIRHVKNSGCMLRNTYNFMLKMYGLPEGSFIPVESREPDPVPKQIGWQTDLELHKDRLCLRILFNGEEVYKGWAGIYGEDEQDLLNAISNAAYTCYKAAEQKALEGHK